MFNTKRHVISQLEKQTYVDKILKDGKKHQVGPLTYKNIDPTFERVDQRNNTGKFHGGILKSNIDQTVFINACRAAASERPQVGKYHPKFVSNRLDNGLSIFVNTSPHQMR